MPTPWAAGSDPQVPQVADRQPSANVFLELPFSYLSGPYEARGQRLPAADDARAAREMGETLLSVSLDNYRQLRAVGSYTGTVRTGEFQFSHFLSPDLYWFANFASAYAGLPTYNQLLGGLGWRWRVRRPGGSMRSWAWARAAMRQSRSTPGRACSSTPSC